MVVDLPAIPSFPFLQLPVEIQIDIIQLVCASDVYAPVFEEASHGRPKIQVPVHLLAVCRHFYQTFKSIIQLIWPARIIFRLASTEVRSREGWKAWTRPWTFAIALRASYPPLIPVTEEDFLLVEWKLRRRLEKCLPLDRDYLRHLRCRNFCRFRLKAGPYETVKAILRKSQRCVQSPQDFVAKNYRTLERIDGAPYRLYSLQEWRSMLPNLHTINFTPVRLEHQKIGNHNPFECSDYEVTPRLLDIVELLDGNNDGLYARCALRWFKDDYLFAKNDRGPDLLRNMSITIVHILNLRRRGPWRHDYQDYNLPGNLLVFTVKIVNGEPSLTRKEWRKSANFLPNKGKPEIPGARFPGWETDSAGNKIGLSQKERSVLHPFAYQSRWVKGRNEMEVAQEIRTEMENWANHVILPQRGLMLWWVKDIHNQRPGQPESQIHRPSFIEGEPTSRLYR